MKVYEAASIRNVAVVGHGGCGKTQLVSALLFASGMVNRLGQVDEGNTVTDYDDEEIARKHTLAASLAYAEWNKTKINLIDTPGFGNFFSDTRAAMRVADGALLVVDAVAGVEVQTEKAWAAAQELESAADGRPQPRRSRARLARAVARIAPADLRPRHHADSAADRRREGLQRASSIWSRMKAYTFATDGSGKLTEGAVPADMADAGERRARSADRDGRRGRRAVDGEVLRRRHADAARSSSPA